MKIVDSSFKARILIISILALWFSNKLYSQTCTALANGNWTTASNWSCGVVPGDGSTVNIPDGITITVSSPVNQTNPRPYIVINIGDDDGDGSGGTISITGPGKLDLLINSPLNVTPNSQTDGTGGGTRMRWYTAAGTEVASLTGNAMDFTGPTTLFNGAEVPLPVELTFLKSEKTSNGVLVTWQTATELNNDYFDVERSEDGVNFYKIARMAGAGTTSAVQNYQYIDKAPINNVEYYRLKQVDFDGAFEYSKIIAGYADQLANQMQMTAYPNPAAERVAIKSVRPVEFAEIQLINIAGQTVANLTEKVQGFGLNLEVDLPVLEKGMYYIKYRTVDGQVGTHKLLIK